MDQLNITEIVARFKERITETKEAEKFREEVVTPMVTTIFETEFINVFEKLAVVINEQVGTEVIKCYTEGDSKFNVEGIYHRIYFQKSNIDIISNTVYINIIPIYIWKGVTKHLGPISLFVNLETNETKWDLPNESIELYAKKLFSGFTEDKDFNI